MQSDANGISSSVSKVVSHLQKIVYNIDANPKTIDPQLNSAVDGSKVIRNTFEGLMREIENGEVENGIAEGYEVSEDGLVYTFHIRDNAKWSDGEDVTAKDFEYAWKRALNPNTAAEYAYQLFYQYYFFAFRTLLPTYCKILNNHLYFLY